MKNKILVEMKTIGMRYILVVVVAVILTSCQVSNVECPSISVSAEKSVCPEMCGSLELIDSSIPFKNIKDFLVLENEEVIVTDGRRICKFDSVGQYISDIGDQGRARGEFINCGNLYATDSILYVWDESSMKLIAYDTRGLCLYEMKGPDEAIGKFSVDNHNKMAAFYITGRGEELIKVFSLSDKKMIGEYGKVTNKDILTFFRAISGGASWMGDQLFYLNPTSLTINTIKNKREELAFSIEDEAFNCAPVIYNIRDAKEISHMQEGIRYFDDNSVVTGLRCDADTLKIMYETGLNGKYEEPDSVFYANRKLNIVFVDDGLNMQKYFQMPYPCGAYLFNIKHDILYALKRDGEVNIIERFLLK